MVSWLQRFFGRMRTTVWPRVLRVHRSADRPMALICGLATMLALVLVFSVGRYLYVGTAAPGIPFAVSASCLDSAVDRGASCGIVVQQLGNGRLRVTAAEAETRQLLLTLEPEHPAGTLLLRRGSFIDAVGPDLR